MIIIWLELGFLNCELRHSNGLPTSLFSKFWEFRDESIFHTLFSKANINSRFLKKFPEVLVSFPWDFKCPWALQMRSITEYFTLRWVLYLLIWIRQAHSKQVVTYYTHVLFTVLSGLNPKPGLYLGTLGEVFRDVTSYVGPSPLLS